MFGGIGLRSWSGRLLWTTLLFFAAFRIHLWHHRSASQKLCLEVCAPCHPLPLTQGERHLKIAVAHQIEKALDPAHAVERGDRWILQNFSQGLFRWDRDQAIVPDLAIQILEEGDGFWRIHLCPEGRWSSGEPVTAEDFVRSWRRLEEPTTSPQHQTWFKDLDITHLEALNPTSLRLGLHHPMDQKSLMSHLVHPAALPIHRETARLLDLARQSGVWPDADACPVNGWMRPSWSASPSGARPVGLTALPNPHFTHPHRDDPGEEVALHRPASIDFFQPPAQMEATARALDWLEIDEGLMKTLTPQDERHLIALPALRMLLLSWEIEPSELLHPEIKLKLGAFISAMIDRPSIFSFQKKFYARPSFNSLHDHPRYRAMTPRIFSWSEEDRRAWSRKSLAASMASMERPVINLNLSFSSEEEAERLMQALAPLMHEPSFRFHLTPRSMKFGNILPGICVKLKLVEEVCHSGRLEDQWQLRLKTLDQSQDLSPLLKNLLPHWHQNLKSAYRYEEDRLNDFRNMDIALLEHLPLIPWMKGDQIFWAPEAGLPRPEAISPDGYPVWQVWFERSTLVAHPGSENPSLNWLKNPFAGSTQTKEEEA